ncbi:MAG: glycosyltransferase family 4 protein [Patescibacteria group bacterium]|jgi:glycosyltransferase involved in cell wall biosynthesis
MKPKIAILASNLYPIPPKATNAAELIVSQITEGLVALGYPVTLYAAGDTKTKARLVSVTKKASISDPKIGMTNHKTYETLLTSQAYADANQWGAKILLSNIAMVSAPFARFGKFPSVALLHSPPTFTDSQIMLDNNKFQKYISISNAQRKAVKHAHYVGTIYHGVDTNKLKFHPQAGKYLAFLGRIRDYKGVVEAIQVSKATKMPLKIAGPIGDQKYFDKFVKPNLSKNIKFVGEINHAQKSEFLGNALATLFPIGWEEPFGLVVPESLACGTPVVAFKRGSVPEILKNQKTGYIVTNVKQMISAVKNINKISRVVCRKEAEKRFSVNRMVLDYAKLLTRLTRPASPSASAVGGRGK